MAKSKSERYFWPALVLSAVLAGSISLIIGLGQSVWFDEAYSVLLAQHSWSEIVRLTAQDVHPPVYYWLLKVWIVGLGSGELALRSLSVLLFGLSVGVAGLLTRRLFGTRAALVTLSFLVFAPFLMRYGFEIRMYSLASLIGVTATYILVAALEAKTRRNRYLLYGAYTLLVTLGVYTLYYIALLWLAHCVWLLWRAYQERRPGLAAPGLAAYVIGLALFLPWLPVFMSKMNGATLSPVTHELGFKNLLGIVSFAFLYHPPWHLGVLNLLLIVFVVTAVAYLGVRGFGRATFRERQYLVLLGLYIVVPVVLFILVTHYRPVYIERYVAHILLGGYVFVGVTTALAAARSDRRTHILAAVVGVVLLVGCWNLVQVGNYNFQRLHKPAIKSVAALLSDCRQGAVIFANDPQVAIELGYYIKDCPVYFYNETAAMGGGFAMLSESPRRVADPARELQGARELYYVYYDKPQRSLPVGLQLTGIRTVESLSVASYRHR